MEGLVGPTPRRTPSFASQGPPLTWALGKVLGASVAQLAGPELRGVAGPEQWGAVGLALLSLFFFLILFVVCFYLLSSFSLSSLLLLSNIVPDPHSLSVIVFHCGNNSPWVSRAKF